MLQKMFWRLWRRDLNKCGLDLLNTLATGHQRFPPDSGWQVVRIRGTGGELSSKAMSARKPAPLNVFRIQIANVERQSCAAVVICWGSGPMQVDTMASANAEPVCPSAPLGS